MKPHSNHQLRIADEDQWHAVLGGGEADAVPPLDARDFANQVRQKYHRRLQRRRWVVGGALSAILFLTVVIRPARDEAVLAPQTVGPSKAVEPRSLAQPEPIRQRNIATAERLSSEVAIDELNSMMTQLAKDIKALNDAERSAEQCRRLKNAALRVADQIRQQAEISVFSSSTRPDPSAS